MLDMASVLRASRFLAGYLRPTPLVYSPFLSDTSGAEVWLKLECAQPTGSFKVRGALTRLGRLSPAEKTRGLAVASAGNHALGVAFAAHRLGGFTAEVFVPATAPQAKLEKLRRYPVRLRVVGQSYQEAHEAAEAFAADSGALPVPAYDDLDIIAGQATVGLEVLLERPESEVILAPVGGGGLIAGIATVVAALRPGGRVIGVQPEASPAALLSLRDGVAYDPYDHKPTLADGLAGGFGAVPLAVAGHLISKIVLASEAELRRAIFTLADREKLIVEASGAIAITPLLDGQPDLRGRQVVCVLTGSNLDTALLGGILEEYAT